MNFRKIFLILFVISVFLLGLSYTVILNREINRISITGLILSGVYFNVFK